VQTKALILLFVLSLGVMYRQIQVPEKLEEKKKKLEDWKDIR